MHLTIQDYFQYGAVSRYRSRNESGVNAQKIREASPFSKVLDAAQSLSAEQGRGLTIQDYMNKRVYSQSNVSRQVSQTFRPSGLEDEVQSIQPGVSGIENNSAESLPSIDEEPEIGILEPETAPDDDSQRILSSIQEAADRFGLPRALIQAVIKAESNYNVRAVSPAGAQGLMQLMPATARDLGVVDPFDIEQNIHGGARYLKKMLDQFNGDVKLALSAYNAGPGTVARYNGSVPPYEETRTYIKRVLHFAEKLSTTDFT